MTSTYTNKRGKEFHIQENKFGYYALFNGMRVTGNVANLEELKKKLEKY